MLKQVPGFFPGCTHSTAEVTHIFTTNYNALGMRVIMGVLLWEHR